MSTSKRPVKHLPITVQYWFNISRTDTYSAEERFHALQEAFNHLENAWLDLVVFKK